MFPSSPETANPDQDPTALPSWALVGGRLRPLADQLRAMSDAALWVASCAAVECEPAIASIPTPRSFGIVSCFAGDGYAVICVVGPAKGRALAQVRKQIVAVLEGDTRWLVIDVSAVTEHDHMLRAVLRRTQDMLRLRQGRLTITPFASELSRDLTADAMSLVARQRPRST
jgi:hypothetical protein